MPAVKIFEDVHWVGTNDRVTDLFEGMWPITREGVSYNSYIIQDEKTTLVDLVKETKVDPFLRHIGSVADVRKLDYIIINHTEPDHTGALPIVRQLAPNAKIFCTKRAAEMIYNFYGINEHVHVIEDGETLSLGRHSLSFHTAPLLHWPDTMLTYMPSRKILFTCDAFGGYGALPGYIFDDQCPDLSFYKQEALRYYANIVCRFSPAVRKAIKKVTDAGLTIDIVAPGHGLVWRKDPGAIIGLYGKWADYFEGKTEKRVSLLYGSMYGNTRRYMETVAQGLAEQGIAVDVFDIVRTHSSYILPAVLRNQGVVLGVPTYEAGLFPPAAHLMDMIERKNIKHRDAAVFGSFLWSGGAQKEFKQLIDKMNWNLVKTQEFQGGYKEGDIPDAYTLGQQFGQYILSKDLQVSVK
jgi:anaerobic nitric oxide reductase flavorubredoxin